MRFNTYFGTWVLAFTRGTSRKIRKVDTGYRFRKNLCKLLWTPSRFLVSSTTSFPGQRLNTAHTRFAKENFAGQNFGLFSVPAPSTCFSERRGFLFLAGGLPANARIEQNRAHEQLDLDI